MAKSKPTKKREVPKTMVSFRFKAETLHRMDDLLDKPPSLLFDGFRGFPRSRTELVETMIYLLSEGKLQQADSTQTPPTPQV